MTMRRRIMLGVTKGRVVTYRDTLAVLSPVEKDELPLPVFSTDTIEQAKVLLARFCKKSYDGASYILAPMPYENHGASRELGFGDLAEITKLFDDFYSTIKTAP